MLFKKNKVFIESTDITCSICLDTITKNAYKTGCGHCYHKECIQPILRNTRKCPCCRTIIPGRKRWFNAMLNNTKKWVGDTIEYYTNHHLLLSLTVGVPFMYLGVLLGIILIILEGTLTVKNAIVPDLEVD